MNFPRLKNALLCKIILYAVVIGAFFVPIVSVAILSFVPEIVKVIVFIGLTGGLLVYVIKNSAVLMAVYIVLEMLHCRQTARKRFALPRSFSATNAEKKIARFGKKCEPAFISPKPETLRYKSNAPITVYSSGIEKVVATYRAEFLDKSQYRLIVNSAAVNSNALKGKKKHRFLDGSQKRHC